jgi:hypothetical protein
VPLKLGTSITAIVLVPKQGHLAEDGEVACQVDSILAHLTTLLELEGARI